MTRWFDESDDTDLALAFGLECADCGRFSGPVARGWLTCPLPESVDEHDSLEPVLFFCPACAAGSATSSG